MNDQTMTDSQSRTLRLLQQLLAHYPGSQWGADNYVAFVAALDGLPEWALMQTVTTWAAAEPYPPRSAGLFANRVKQLVKAAAPDESGAGCGQCVGGWVECVIPNASTGELYTDQNGRVLDNAARPCSTCRPEQYARWQRGDLAGGSQPAVDTRATHAERVSALKQVVDKMAPDSRAGAER